MNPIPNRPAPANTPQSGFTLVEIAMVLVIVGLLIGGVLKGQELIYNQKVKATYDIYRQYNAAISGYQDRYKALPGDDPSATGRGFVTASTDPTIVNGNGDGQITYNAADCSSATVGQATEACQANYHLRLAGFITGGYGTQAANHPFGGPSDIFFGTAFVTSFAFNTVGWKNLTNRVALQIDTSYDDGRDSSGAIRGALPYTTNFTTSPDATTTWVASKL